MVAFPGSVVRLEDCQGAAVAQFPERPHCHVSLSQRTLTAIDQRGQAPDSITAETCDGTITSGARVKPDDAFQYEQGDATARTPARVHNTLRFHCKAFMIWIIVLVNSPVKRR